MPRVVQEVRGILLPQDRTIACRQLHDREVPGLVCLSRRDDVSFRIDRELGGASGIQAPAPDLGSSRARQPDHREGVQGVDVGHASARDDVAIVEGSDRLRGTIPTRKHDAPALAAVYPR